MRITHCSVISYAGKRKLAFKYEYDERWSYLDLE